jgi:hypothetical protein
VGQAGVVLAEAEGEHILEECILGLVVLVLGAGVDHIGFARIAVGLEEGRSVGVHNCSERTGFVLEVAIWVAEGTGWGCKCLEVEEAAAWAFARKGRAVIVTGDRNHRCEKRKQDVPIEDVLIGVEVRLGLGIGLQNSWWGILQRVMMKNYKIRIVIEEACWS